MYDFLIGKNTYLLDEAILKMKVLKWLSYLGNLKND